MTTNLTDDGLDPFEDPVDRLLAQIALELQLPPSLHDQVGGRYEAVRRKLESTPEFENAIEHFYPQGSMAIDATISTRGTDDEYDLDIVAQLGGRFRRMSPLSILVELERALSDYPVSAVKRQTRCVTLYYADKMHLDITPGFRASSGVERESSHHPRERATRLARGSVRRYERIRLRGLVSSANADRISIGRVL